MEETVKSKLVEHIKEKIQYHEELRLKYEAEENYEQCAIHRDEIKRLKNLINED